MMLVEFSPNNISSYIGLIYFHGKEKSDQSVINTDIYIKKKDIMT